MAPRDLLPPEPAQRVSDWPDQLVLSLPAHAANVVPLRQALTAWLGGDHLAEDVIDDLVLATSEALENCCDHAFAGVDAPGTMTLHAHEGERGTVITIDDDGYWQQPPTDGPTHRGRGLTMIRALVDDVELATTGAGTHVVLHHHRATA